MSNQNHLPISFDSELTLKNAICFPLQTEHSRRDLLIGGALLFIPIIGWILNLGHRIEVTHRIINHHPHPWSAWSHPKQLFRHGLITLTGMILYHLPSAILALIAFQLDSNLLYILSLMLWLLATAMIPGYMTAYCVDFDTNEVFNARRSLSRVINAKSTYWRAWGYTLIILTISFVGLLGFGLAFLWTSVWFWQSAAFCFANTMTKQCVPNNTSS